MDGLMTRRKAINGGYDNEDYLLRFLFTLTPAFLPCESRDSGLGR